MFLVFWGDNVFADALHKGHNALRQGHWNQAIKFYKQAEEDLGKQPQIYWYLGHAFYGKGRYQYASAYYQKALQGLPLRYHDKILNNIGDTLYKRGKLPHAMQYYAKALKLNPNYERARYNLELTLRHISPPPPPPPPKQQKQRKPPKNKRTKVKNKKTKLKHQMIAPPKINEMKMPDPRQLHLKPFDRFVPYSRILKNKNKFLKKMR